MKLLKSKTAVGLLCSLSLLAACASDSEFSARSSKANASNPSSFGGENTDLDAIGEPGEGIGGEYTDEEKEAIDSLAEVIAGEGGFMECEARSVKSDQPIIAKVYKVSKSGNDQLLGMPSNTPVDEICMDNFDIPTRSFTEGFPGVPDLYEWFGIRATTKILIPKAGEYTFYLNSDDGSRLYINGTEVIDHDGTHATSEKSGKITLPVGAHKLEVRYFQGPATEIALQLLWKTPFNSSKTIVPKSSFRYYE